jgi:hypothetical protein
VDRVRSIDPGHPVLVVACGVCGGAGTDSTGAHAAPFSDIDSVLGTDQYPIFTAPPDAAAAGRWVGAGMRGVQSVADRSSRQTAIVLQSFSWGFAPIEARACGSSPANCRFPTREEMAAQRDAALANGKPRLILWYALFDVIGTLPAQMPADWTPPADPDRRWQDLVAAAFAPEPVQPVVTPPPAGRGRLAVGGHVSAASVSYPIRGSRVIGRLRLSARFGEAAARVDLRSTRLKLAAGRRFLVRACIIGAGATHCRSHWRRGRVWAPHVTVRAPGGSAGGTFSARVTVWARGRRGRLVRVAASHVARGAGLAPPVASDD